MNHGKEREMFSKQTESCLVEKENQDISYVDQHFVQIMFCGIFPHKPYIVATFTVCLVKCEDNGGPENL